MRQKKRNSKPNLVIKAMFEIAIIKLKIHFEINSEFRLGNN